jgi:CubicO group peptidase (beta-lactamase class C family)
MQTIPAEEAGFSSERLERIPKVMHNFVDRGDLAGTLTLLARHGQVFHCATTGLADIESQRPMPVDGIFRIYSMTKPVTVTAVLMLLEEGHFLLDDPITNWLPEFAEMMVYVGGAGDAIGLTDLERPITIRHLLTHSAGLSYGFETDHPVDKLYQQAKVFEATSGADLMQRLCQLPLVNQPGERFWYSLAHDVLGYLIALISGQTLDVFFQERIFKPLEMVDTGFWIPREKLDRLVTMYAPKEGGGLQVAEGPEVDRTACPPVCSGGGGLLSTAADYLNFAQMLLNRGEFRGRRLLSRKTFEVLTTPHLPFPPGEVATDLGFSMGLGVSILTDLSQGNRRGSLGSFGWGGAAGTRFWVDPQEDLVGILMAQTMPGNWRAPEMFESLAYAALLD